MGTTKGIVQIEGTIGNMTFYRKDGKNLVREKGGVNKDRILNDPNFVRTRENNSEFKNAASSAKVLRNACRLFVEKAKDSKVVGRLTGLMLKVAKSDTTSVRGERQVLLGDKSMLNGFEFNSKGLLSSTLFAPIVLSVNPQNGLVEFSVNLNPSADLASLRGASHFSISLGCVNGELIDNSETIFMKDEGAKIAIENASQLIELSVDFQTGITKPLFVLLLLNYFQEVNGLYYSMNNGSHDCLKIIHVE